MTGARGIQEENILGISCMILRKNTERPVTVSEGTNRLIPITTKDILIDYRYVGRGSNGLSGHIPKFWDGQAAERIVGISGSNSHLLHLGVESAEHVTH